MHLSRARLIAAAALLAAGVLATSCTVPGSRLPQSSVGTTAQPAASTESSPAAQNGTLGRADRLSVADVRRLFDDWARFETAGDEMSGDDYAYEYGELVRRNVDFRAYAADEASAFPRYSFGSDPKPLYGKARTKQIAKALAAYDRVVSRRGPAAAYQAVVFAWDRVEHCEPTRSELLLDSLAPDFGLLDFMTSPTEASEDNADPEWSWAVTGISIEGTDTARITYSAKTNGAAGWTFKDPQRRYEKVWRFSYDASSKRWRLATWPNRLGFIESVDSNINDPDDTLLRRAGQPFYWLM